MYPPRFESGIAKSQVAIAETLIRLRRNMSASASINPSSDCPIKKRPWQVSYINIHIRNILAEGELDAESVIKDFLITASDGKNYRTMHYNLDMVISVGYRIKSKVATRFRIWATERLKEYLIKGFTLDDKRLKQNGGGSYFDELLARIRDIRSSEKVFWRKVLDIYATSIDYDPKSDLSREFFKIIQNKMHWASHGHTAAEIICQRADAGKTNMGLTNWPAFA